MSVHEELVRLEELRAADAAVKAAIHAAHAARDKVAVWQQTGELDTFGRPRSEMVAAAGKEEQYAEACAVVGRMLSEGKVAQRALLDASAEHFVALQSRMTDRATVEAQIAAAEGPRVRVRRLDADDVTNGIATAERRLAAAGVSDWSGVRLTVGDFGRVPSSYKGAPMATYGEVSWDGEQWQLDAVTRDYLRADTATRQDGVEVAVPRYVIPDAVLAAHTTRAGKQSDVIFSRETGLAISKDLAARPLPDLRTLRVGGFAGSGVGIHVGDLRRDRRVAGLTPSEAPEESALEALAEWAGEDVQPAPEAESIEQASPGYGAHQRDRAQGGYSVGY